MTDRLRQPEEFHFDLFADYSQFYLQDEQADLEGSESVWTEQTVADMVAVAPCQLYIGTVRNMTVSMTVIIAGTAPDNDFAAWDHVADASLDVPSGRIVIAGCSDFFPDAARISVAAGRYRVRIYYGALDSVDEEYGLEGDDHYRVVLWPATVAMQPSVLKRWVSTQTYDSMTQNPLIGTWRLSSHQEKDADGRVTFPFGESPMGHTLYGNQGYMSVVAMTAASERSGSRQAPVPISSIEQDAAIAGYLAYSGRYEFTGPNVEHHIEVSSQPDWVGSTLVYGVSFTGVDGKQRINLFTRTDMDGNEKKIAWWTWERIVPADHAS